jgi:type IV pilus assembly protein PilZ
MADSFMYFYSQDLSMGGMFLKTRSPFPLGTRLMLDFELPGRTRRVMVVGEVARAVLPDLANRELEPGMGIAFTAIDPESQAELKEFLEQT